MWGDGISKPAVVPSRANQALHQGLHAKAHGYVYHFWKLTICASASELLQEYNERKGFGVRASGAEGQADDTDIDLATGINTPKTDDERRVDADDGPPKTKTDGDALEDSEIYGDTEEDKGEYGL